MPLELKVSINSVDLYRKLSANSYGVDKEYDIILRYSSNADAYKIIALHDKHKKIMYIDNVSFSNSETEKLILTIKKIEKEHKRRNKPYCPSLPKFSKSKEFSDDSKDSLTQD